MCVDCFWNRIVTKWLGCGVPEQKQKKSEQTGPVPPVHCSSKAMSTNELQARPIKKQSKAAKIENS